ncbi:hypothetical protein BJX61DRAFT_495263 [Aspergillus egyptiacus]|nr:hypothetical protein BJX61DRAFT_495263 [Aspergillus egyptiacus]
MPPARALGKGAKKSCVCPYCQRGFRRLEHLQRHVRLHTNEKPYTCTCGESFARRDLLKRHHRLVHDGQEPSPTSSHGADGPFAKGIQANDSLIAPSAGDQQDPSLYSPLPLHRTANSAVTPISEQEHSEEHPVNNRQDPDMGYTNLSSVYPSLEEFTDFVDSMGLALDLGSPLNFGLLPETDPNDISQDNRTNIQTSGPDPAEEHIESGHRAQMPTLLPIPLNQWSKWLCTPRDASTVANNWTFSLFHRTSPGCHLYSALEDHGDAEGKYGTSACSICASCTRIHSTVSRVTDALSQRLLRWSLSPFPLHTLCFIRPGKTPGGANPGHGSSRAQYRYQPRTGRMLYSASKAIFRERQRIREQGAPTRQQLTPVTSTPPGPVSAPTTITDDLRCLLNLMIYATWQQDPEVVRDACDLQSQLVRLLRESGLVEEDTPSSDISTLDWQSWLELEANRRVKLFGFAFLNLQSIAYNLPPILLASEINLRLPCTCDEWRTVNETHWKQVRQNISHEQNLFQDALDLLLDGGKDMPASTLQTIPSPTANLLTLHALLQRILLGRQASLSSSVPQIDILTNALRRWTSTWQLAPESSLDPLNPNGPIPFTSTALLGLAYTRLQLDLGPCRMLKTQDPRVIASAMIHSPPISRDPHLLPALLHATHALSIPVKLGVEYVSRSQAFVWSIQHALCGLEFAVLLDKWLKVVGRTREEKPLEEHEQRLLDWIQRVVDEGRSSVEDEHDMSGAGDCDRLAFFVVRLWARIMRGNAQWPFVDVIGQSLEIYASGAAVVTPV